MPSGSRVSGGAGNHGGFSSSRSSGFGSSGGFGGSSSFRPRGPRYIHFGHRTLIITTGRQSAISVIAMLIVFALIAIFGFSASKTSLKEELLMVEEEYRYYQAMITRAESDDDYVWTAEVVDQKYDQQYGKYCIYYEFDTKNHVTVEGYTFYVYTLENLPRIGSEIIIAVDKSPVDSETDSIPMDYKFTTLEDDGYYTYLKKTNKNITIFVVLASIGVAGGIAGIIAIIFTSKKKEEEKQEAERQEKIQIEKKKYCEYCGTKIKEEDKTCPNCGSRLDGRIN